MNDQVKELIMAGQTTVYNQVLIHYQDLGLDNDDLVIFIQINRLQSQGDMASPALIASAMKVTEKAISTRIQNMMKKGLVNVQSIGARQEFFDFAPLYEKLIEGKGAQVDNRVVSTGQQSRREVMKILQGEFGRALSPMEMQTVNQWFDQDHFDPNMMTLAIQEAVANNARSLRYIEAILVNWKRDNLTSPQAVQMANEKRRAVSYQTGNSRYQKRTQGQDQKSAGPKPKVPNFKFDQF
ncbi:DnaD domain protein [Fructobacillus sp. M2-14]|uniref:DnaD domain protein n=1 Tax=Fructobacillus broussonetiae TaxID=2713173 RepID=A0ABS5R0W0_9LACO|nr:DnaD domain protein [Fructobacillus broussonetiae]MBS9339088.1 DnaD domain protein [Fructobacillus broussonetiae]